MTERIFSSYATTQLTGEGITGDWHLNVCTCLRHACGNFFLFDQLGGTEILLNRFDSGKIFLGASPIVRGEELGKSKSGHRISSRARFLTLDLKRGKTQLRVLGST